MNKTTKSILALIVAAMGALLGGLLTGALAGLLSNVLYIVFLFPLGMGLVAGTLLEKTIAATKIKNAAQGVFLGCLAAAAVIAAYHAANYAVFRARLVSEMNRQMVEERGISDLQIAGVLADYALQEKTGFSGFPGYILYMDKRGITIGRMFGSGINLGPFFTWVFWAAELAIVAWLAITMGKTAAGRPFCEACNRWYGREQHLGGVRTSLSAKLAGLLERRDFTQAGALLEADAPVPSLEVYAQSCEGCESSDTRLQLKRFSRDRKGRLSIRLVSQLSIRPPEKAELLYALRPARPEPLAAATQTESI